MNAGFDIASSTDNGKDGEGLFSLAKRGLFGALFELKQRKPQSNERFFYASVSIMALQLTYLPFSKMANFKWPVEFAEKVRSILEVFAFGFVDIEQDSLFLLVLVICLAVTILQVVGVCFFAMEEISSKQNQSTSKGTLALPLRWLLRVNQTILQIPIIALFARGIRGNDLPSFPNEVVLIVSALSAVCLILHVGITSLFSLCVIEHLPFGPKGYDKTLYACPHGRVEFCATLIRAAVTVMFVGVGASADGDVSTMQQGVLVTINLLSGIALVWIYFHWLPWFNMGWNKFSVANYTVYLWAGVCAAVAQMIRNPEDQSSLVLFSASMIFCIISILSLTSARATSLAETELNKLTGSAYLMEVSLRIQHMSDLKANAYLEFTGDVESNYRKAVELLPSSPYTNLTVAAIVICCSKKVIYSLNLLKQARQNTNALDMEFMLYYHNKMTREKRLSSSSDVSFLEADNHIAQAKQSLIQALKYTSSFWKNVARGSFSARDLLEHGSKVHHSALEVRQSLQKLAKLRVSSKETNQLQAMYYQYIMNDRDMAFRIMAKNNSNGSSESGSAAICSISGDKGSLGHILEVSKGLLELFGYSKSDLIGQNVSCLCPAPFQSVHDMFLQQFLALDNDFVSQARRVFGLHQAGHVMTLDLEITPNISLSGELILAAKFTPVPQNDCSHFLLVDGKTGLVTGMSKHSAELLRVDEHDLYTLNVNVKDVVPEFYNMKPNEENNNVKVEGVPDQSYKLRFRSVQYKSKPEAPVNFDINVFLVYLTAVDNSLSLDDQINAIREQEREFEEGSEDGSAFGDVGDGDGDGDAGPESLGSKALKFAAEESRPANYVEVTSPAGSFKKKKKTLVRPTMPDNRSVGSRSKRSGRMGGGSDFGKTEETSQTSGAGALDVGTMSIRQIQKMISRNLKKKDPKLQHFSRFGKRFMTFFFCFIVLNSVVKVILARNFLDIVSRMQDAHAVGTALSMVANMLVYKHTEGAVVNGSLVPRNQYDTDALVQSNFESLKSKHLLTASFVESSLKDTTTAELFFSPSIEITSELDEVRTVSYHVAVLELIGHIENYVEEANDNDCGDSCSFILHNVMYDVFQATLSTARAMRLVWNDFLGEMELIDNIILGVLVGILAISFIVGYVPMFINNERRKNKVAHAFTSIPEKVAKTLQQRTERRLNLVYNPRDDWFSLERDEIDFEMDEVDGDGLDDPVSPAAGASQAFGSFKSSSGKSSSKKASAAKVEPAPQKGANKDTKKAGKKQSSRGSRDSCVRRIFSLLFSVVQVGITFWIVLGFFLTMNVLSQEVDEVMRELASAVFISGEQLSLFYGLTFWATLPMDSDKLDIKNRTFQVERMNEYLSQMDTYDSAVKYGNAELGVSGFTNSEDRRFPLFFENACFDQCQAYLARGGPDSRVSDLKHGLVLALDRKLDVFRQVSSAIEQVNDNQDNHTLAEALQEQKVKLNDFEPQLLLGDQLKSSVETEVWTLENLVVSIKTRQIVACCIFVTLLSFGHLLSMRTFQRMDRDLKKSQTLLLVLPEQLFHNVPAIVELLDGH